MNILFVGDIFGSAGRRIVREHMGHVRETHNVELTIVNAENAAGGFGVTPQIAEEIFDWGADVLTTGNHVWDKRELVDYFKSVPLDSQKRPRRVLRPANFAPGLYASESSRRAISESAMRTDHSRGVEPLNELVGGLEAANRKPKGRKHAPAMKKLEI